MLVKTEGVTKEKLTMNRSFSCHLYIGLQKTKIWALYIALGGIESRTTIKLYDSKVHMSSIFALSFPNPCLQNLNNDIKTVCDPNSLLNQHSNSKYSHVSVINCYRIS